MTTSPMEQTITEVYKHFNLRPHSLDIVDAVNARIGAALDCHELHYEMTEDILPDYAGGALNAIHNLRATLLGTTKERPKCSTCGQARDHDRTSPCSNSFHALGTTEERHDA